MIIRYILKKRILVPWIIFSGFLVSIEGCRPKTTPLVIPQLVKTAVVNEHGGISSISYPGKIQAASNVKLAFRVPGPIKKIYVKEGEYVRKNQLLAELDARDYRLQYNATLAEYNQVKDESDRIIELYHRGSVSVNEYDKAVAAKKRVTSLYNMHKNALNDTRLRAPFDGYIQKKYYEDYEIVNQGIPVLSIIDNNYFEIDIDIPTSDFIRQEDFINYYAVADVYPDSILPIELMDITQGANYNQLFQARFRLKRSDSLMLAAGMSVTVTINFKPSSGKLVTIPIAALFQKDGRSFVWVYDERNEQVRMVPVEVRQILKNGIAVVRSELRKGQIIIAAGVNSLKEGEKVRLLPPVSASNVGGLL